MIRIREAFDFGPWAYNVDKAREILTAAPRERIPVDVIPLMDIVAAGEVDLDRAYAAGLKDITQPLIVIPPPVSDARPGLLAHLDRFDVDLPIDGWHRAFRAFLAGLETVEAYKLTTAEADSIRFLIPPDHRRPRTATPVRDLRL